MADPGGLCARLHSYKIPLIITHAMNDTTNLFGCKLGESTENNKALLFFSGKETIQTSSGSI